MNGQNTMQIKCDGLYVATGALGASSLLLRFYSDGSLAAVFAAPNASAQSVGAWINKREHDSGTWSANGDTLRFAFASKANPQQKAEFQGTMGAAGLRATWKGTVDRTLSFTFHQVALGK